MKRKVIFCTLLGKKNLKDNVIYSKESFLKALDDYIENGGVIYDKMEKCLNDKSVKVIGKILNKKIINNEIICEVEIDEKFYEGEYLNCSMVGKFENSKFFSIEKFNRVNLRLGEIEKN